MHVQELSGNSPLHIAAIFKDLECAKRTIQASGQKIIEVPSWPTFTRTSNGCNVKRSVTLGGNDGQKTAVLCSSSHASMSITLSLGSRLYKCTTKGTLFAHRVM